LQGKDDRASQSQIPDTSQTDRRTPPETVFNGHKGFELCRDVIPPLHEILY
jgi:hypothetical protein